MSPRPDYTVRPGEAVRVFRDGDARFAIGCGRVTIASGDVLFVSRVVADLGRLVHDPAGEAALKDGDALGRRVTIMKPDLATDPPNAWTLPDDLAAACAAGVALGGNGRAARRGSGAGCGSTIVYDPEDWPRPGDPASPSRVAVLLMLLRQANLNARGGSDPAKLDWGAGEARPENIAVAIEIGQRVDRAA
jgi:hypothetical protein